MPKEKLRELSTEQLIVNEKRLKGFIIAFIPIILLLCFFLFRDYFITKEIDLPVMIIAISTIGGLAFLFTELQKIKEEISRRN